jgi:hypothetical protein
MMFAGLSVACGVAAIAIGETWLLLPYGGFALLAVACSAMGCRVAPWQAGGAILVPIGFTVGAWLAEGVEHVQESANRTVATGQLKMLGLGMHNYYGQHGRFPPATLGGANGNALLSWRVSLLPYIEQRALHQRFKLDEPWDSPHNYALLAEMPDTYAAKHRPEVAAGMTVFQVFVGRGTAFDPAKPLQLPPTDFPGGPRELVLIAEAAQPVPWTKPEDLPYAEDQPLPALGSVRKYKHAPVLFVPSPVRAMVAVDASAAVHWVDLGTIDEETLRHYIALRDGDE